MSGALRFTSPSRTKLVLSSLALFLVFGLIGFHANIDPALFLDRLRQVPPMAVVGFAAATFCAIALTVWKWRLVLQWLVPESPVRFWEGMDYCILGVGAGLIGSQFGSLGVRGGLLTLEKNIPISRSVLSILLEQLTDLLVFFLFATGSLWFFMGSRDLLQALGMDLILILFLFVSLRVFGSSLLRAIVNGYLWGTGWVKKWIGSRRSEPTEGSGYHKDVASLTAQMPDALIQSLFLLAVAKYFFLGGGLLFIAKSAGLHMAMPLLLMAIPLISVSNILSLFPGSLDLSFYGVMVLVGASPEEAFAYVTFMRLISTVTVLALVAVALGNRAMKRFKGH